MSIAVSLPDGARLAFSEAGVGAPGRAPIVFLHGFPLHRGMWAPQLAALQQTHRCLAPDLRGFGESTAGSERLTIDRMADDVAAFLDHLLARRATIVGLSMGGYVALAMWRRHRERVASLVLADTRAAGDSDEARAKRADMIAIARAEGSEGVADKQLTGLLGKTTRESKPELVASTRAMVASTSVDAIVAGLEALRDRPDSTPLLSTIDVPTLLLCGEDDAITPAKEMRELASAIPGATLEIIEGAGHLSNLERPAEFNAAIARHLAR